MLVKTKKQKEKTKVLLIGLRVAGVGRLSVGAKTAINSLVKQVFANSRKKNVVYFAFNQKPKYIGIHAF